MIVLPGTILQSYKALLRCSCCQSPAQEVEGLASRPMASQELSICVEKLETVMRWQSTVRAASFSRPCCQGLRLCCGGAGHGGRRRDHDPTRPQIAGFQGNNAVLFRPTDSSCLRLNVGKLRCRKSIRHCLRFCRGLLRECGPNQRLEDEFPTWS